MSPRTPVSLVAFLFVTTAVAGCLGSDDDVSPDALLDRALAALGCPTDASNLMIVHFDAAKDLGLPAGHNVSVSVYPEEATVEGPATLCIVNDVDVDRKLLAMEAPIQDLPNWVAQAAADKGLPVGADPHAAHKAAGALPGPFIMEPLVRQGETLVLPVKYIGGMAIHDGNDVSILTTWTTLPPAEETYPVAANGLGLKWEANGDTAAGTTDDATADNPLPDLYKMKALLEWDDAVDDPAAGGATANKEDTLKLEIVDPSGTVVQSKQATARAGKLQIDADFDNGAFPDSVTGRGEAEAVAALHGNWTPDDSRTGRWTFKVTVIAAAGPAADSDGTTQPVSPDVGQAWNLTVEFFHEYPFVVGPGDLDAFKVWNGRL